jgi:hypothetical protein
LLDFLKQKHSILIDLALFFSCNLAPPSLEQSQVTPFHFFSPVAVGVAAMIPPMLGNSFFTEPQHFFAQNMKNRFPLFHY